MLQRVAASAVAVWHDCVAVCCSSVLQCIAVWQDFDERNQRCIALLLQCECVAAVCCTVLQRSVALCCALDHDFLKSDISVAVCRSVLLCVAVWHGVVQHGAVCCRVFEGVAGCCRVSCFNKVIISIQGLLRCSVFLCLGTWRPHVLQCVAVCCSVLQCVAVCCSVLNNA